MTTTLTPTTSISPTTTTTTTLCPEYCCKKAGICWVCVSVPCGAINICDTPVEVCSDYNSVCSQNNLQNNRCDSNNIDISLKTGYSEISFSYSSNVNYLDYYSDNNEIENYNDTFNNCVDNNIVIKGITQTLLENNFNKELNNAKSNQEKTKAYGNFIRNKYACWSPILDLLPRRKK
jgi:hypothetical protein